MAVTPRHPRRIHPPPVNRTTIDTHVPRLLRTCRACVCERGVGHKWRAGRRRHGDVCAPGWWGREAGVASLPIIRNGPASILRAANERGARFVGCHVWIFGRHVPRIKRGQVGRATGRFSIFAGLLLGCCCSWGRTWAGLREAKHSGTHKLITYISTYS